jgi:hypothetical protein
MEAFSFKLGKTNFQSKFLISTFLLLGGRPGSLVSKFLGSKKVDFGILGPKTAVKLTDSYSLPKLKQEGYSLVPEALDQVNVQNILDLSFTLKGANRVMDSGQGFQDGIFFNRENPKTVRFDYNPNDLIADTTIQRLVSDPTILTIAQDYLDTLPVLDFVAMWWHTKSENPDKEAAQYFHFDMDRTRWIKFFFYITDVGPKNGPHIFVPTSHTDDGLPFALRKNGYRRLEDLQVEHHFSNGTWKEFTGAKGSMIVEDTRGLHKGKHVENGDRLVFQIQFTSSLFGTDISSMEISSHKLGAEIRNAMAKIPGVYKNLVVIN